MGTTLSSPVEIEEGAVFSTGLVTSLVVDLLKIVVEPAMFSAVTPTRSLCRLSASVCDRTYSKLVAPEMGEQFEGKELLVTVTVLLHAYH